jgi:hypothetical protein
MNRDGPYGGYRAGAAKDHDREDAVQGQDQIGSRSARRGRALT